MIVTNKIFSTIIIKLGKYQELESTIKQYNIICQKIINYGWNNQTWNKNKLHFGTYKNIRNMYPKFSSALIQTARDQASDILKRTIQKNKKIKYKNNILKYKKKLLISPIKKEMSGIRYDKRSLNIIFDKNIISINTLFGRLKLPFKLAKYYNKYKNWKYSNAQLILKKDKNYYLNLQMIKNLPNKNTECNVLGIDLGIKKIAVCSNNVFYNEKKLKNIKGKYQKMKKDLQRKGTKSAKQKLKKISGKENRFVRNVNHCISKKIVNTKYTVFALENLKNIKNNMKKYNKKLNHMIGNWSFNQLQTFIKYKSERLSKSVIFIKPYYTSQQCSKCSFTDKNNRNGNIFSCNKCNFKLDADLNASRNIARIGRTDFLQGLINNPKVGIDENKAIAILN